ncbi:arsenic transporter [Gordonia sp. PDNC005]|uniref:SLC13 family permease n=1 Tax=unclassified Gordonia (in: high G+C Gram-positive bacteria) TaxID=2657482 RepID=UPI0019624094|nr:SLC13 family permease [Gordonia sp. PDNC005]QRY63034.1 arsenic transporter [Gordonia sp. PDNC005]
MTAASGRWWLVGASVVAGGVLVAVSPDEARSLLERLTPVLVFVAAMSIVVNTAADAGAFDAIAAGLRRIALPRLSAPAATWVRVVVLALVSTVFLSLDTTAIMVTPLAVALARRAGVGIAAIGLAVVWIANIASLLLPVSNLTNLLAVSGEEFVGTGDYLSVMWRPALVATATAVLASWIVYRSSARKPDAAEVEHDNVAVGDRDPRLRTSLVVLGCMLPLLVSPIPYWLTASVGALVLVVVSLRDGVPRVSHSSIPWHSLFFVVALSSAAAVLHSLGATDWLARMLSGSDESTGGLLFVGGVGALLSNLINNIPAFLALEAAVDGHAGTAALLIGVNVGPIIAPWASLATLLWHDQLRRSGVDVPWRRYILAGCILMPFAVIAPIFAI